MNPRCCGQDSEFIVQSINLKYWYCRECRNEVDPNGAKGVPVSAIAALDRDFDGGIAVPPPPGWAIPTPKVNANTGLLRAGDRLEWRHADGSFEMIKITADHVKTIPSTVVTAWVNGNIIYDLRGRQSPTSPTRPAVVAQRYSPSGVLLAHPWNNANICDDCGLAFGDWVQGAGTPRCTAKAKQVP